MRGSIYARRSTHNDNLSPENQVERCESYALGLAGRLGQTGVAKPSIVIDLGHIYIDRGASGRDFDRPEYIRLRRAIDLGEIDILIIYAIDRLGRTEDVTDMLIERRHCIESGVRVWTATEDLEVTANDEVAVIRFFFGSLQAGREREAIRRRCRQGKLVTHHKRPDTLAFGGRPPFGFRVERGSLVADEARRTIVNYLFDMASQGMTAEGIALALNRQKAPAPGGAMWYTRTVGRILSNPVFAGDGMETTYTDPDSGELVTIVVPAPALVTADVFASVQRRMAMRKRSHTAARGIFWLSGLLRCGECGRYLVGCSHGPGKPGSYRCIARAIPKRFDCEPCIMPVIPAALIEGPVWEDMQAVLSDPAILGAALQRGPDEAQIEARLSEIGQEITACKRQQERLVLQWTKDVIASDVLQGAGAALESEIKQLESEAMGLELRQLAFQRRGPAPVNLDGLSPEARAELAQQMISRVDIARLGPKNVSATVFYYLLPDGGRGRRNSYELSTCSMELAATSPIFISR